MMERLKARGLLWSALLGLAVGSTACSNSQPPLGDFMQTAAEQFASLSVQAAMDSPVGVDAADVVRREDCLGFYAKVELGDRDVQPLVILPTKQKWFAVGADCRSRETGEEYTAALDIHVERTIEAICDAARTGDGFDIPDGTARRRLCRFDVGRDFRQTR